MGFGWHPALKFCWWAEIGVASQRVIDTSFKGECVEGQGNWPSQGSAKRCFVICVLEPIIWISSSFLFETSRCSRCKWSNSATSMLISSWNRAALLSKLYAWSKQKNFVSELYYVKTNLLGNFVSEFQHVNQCQDHDFSQKIARAWPRACQIMNDVLLTSVLSFFRTCVWNICNWSELKQHFRAMFLKKTNGRDIEQHFELELFSFAREAASLGASGHVAGSWFSCLFVKAIFGIVFFWKMVPNGTPNGIQSLRK